MVNNYYFIVFIIINIFFLCIDECKAGQSIFVRGEDFDGGKDSIYNYNDKLDMGGSGKSEQGSRCKIHLRLSYLFAIYICII